jgi:hypothetical protein
VLKQRQPSEASGLQWQDVDLQRGLVFVRRSYHLYGYNPPKTHSARRTVELLPESVRVLRALQPLNVAPDTLVFTTTEGKPIEPKTFSEHWYKCLRALALRARGLYCTKDTYVSAALQAVRDPRWVEKQTGVALSTLKTHYEKWMPDPARDELHQLGRAFGAVDVGRVHGRVQDVDPKIADVDPSVKIPLRNPMRGGGLEPGNRLEKIEEIVAQMGRNGQLQAASVPRGDSSSLRSPEAPSDSRFRLKKSTRPRGRAIAPGGCVLPRTYHGQTFQARWRGVTAGSSSRTMSILADPGGSSGSTPGWPGLDGALPRP